MKITCFSTIATAGLLACATLASGAVLEMRNGAELNGRYMGGTQSNLRFETNGEIIVIPVAEILALTMTDSDRMAAPAALAAPATIAAQASPYAAVAIPAGTRLLVRTIDSITSRDRAGKRFSATLEGDLRVDGVLVAPSGAQVFGRIEESKKAGNLAGKSLLELSLTDLMIDGEMRPILTSEFSEQGKGAAGDTVMKTGTAAGIGALAAGGDGAKVGAAVGLGAAAVTRGEELNLPARSLLEFRLTAPLSARVQASAVSQAAGGRFHTVPAGTRLTVRMADSISSNDMPGKRFTAILQGDIKIGDTVVAPSGSNVYGRLEEAKGSGNLAGKSVIEMTLTDIMVRNELRPIATNDYEEKGKQTAWNSALKVGIGAGIGAAIDGGEGARKGAAVGLGAAALTKGQKLNVPLNTLLEFRLAVPLTVRM